jgi:hypothetical protein
MPLHDTSMQKGKEKRTNTNKNKNKIKEDSMFSYFIIYWDDV